MTNIDKKHDTALPATGNTNTKQDAGKGHDAKPQDKVAKPETATPEAPKKDPEAKPAVTEPARKNG